MAPPTTIDSLPNEILMQILDTFPTRSLLPLAAVSQRFNAHVAAVHYTRLVEAATLRDHELILECYHPSAKISTPYLHCEYLGTDGIAETGLDPTLRGLNDLYSRFRPVSSSQSRRPRARYPTKRAIESAKEPLAEEAPSHDVFLDSGELFSQLCTVTNLVKVGPRRGLFLSHANITDGVIRVWRDWLLREAAKTADGTQRVSMGADDSSILWADSSKNVGLKVRVVEQTDMHAPVLVGPEDDPPLSYTLVYEELLIRTNQVLLHMEKSEAQQVTHAGKAVVIASM
ncbi:F-box domain-containing protein [Pseudomassariella vexata]|uniref:F-box domain-containing protein n=1 Tax=Pseudomassariella vexata TaxID=1141098 RepID=A0A1Y2DFR2_9PEZI|nr:F-box domain-containing protein [Pseudomassariella vexata]ORY58122.1 F-box domain-containing protein [Pseudomassariella vexata]